MEFKASPTGCEEASMFWKDIYMPCNQPATKILYCNRDKRDYRMCDMCADHNVRRGMVEKGEFIVGVEQ